MEVNIIKPGWCFKEDLLLSDIIYKAIVDSHIDLKGGLDIYVGGQIQIPYDFPRSAIWLNHSIKDIKTISNKIDIAIYNPLTEAGECTTYGFNEINRTCFEHLLECDIVLHILRDKLKEYINSATFSDITDYTTSSNIYGVANITFETEMQMYNEEYDF